MSKYIKLNESIIDNILKEIKQELKSKRADNGSIYFNKNIKDERNKKATLIIKPKAYSKMLSLLMNYQSEIAWHGVCIRDAKENNTFILQDVLVYPQTVTGVTVDMDEEKYQEWEDSLTDYEFNNLRFQAHSHVNMSPTPSGRDLESNEKIVSRLKDDMFYIFMIINKKLDYTIKIYDMKENTYYEKEDVKIITPDTEFLQQVNNAVRKHEERRPAYQQQEYDWTKDNSWYENYLKKRKEEKKKGKNQK